MEHQKLLVDIRFLQDQYFRRGIGRYGWEIINRLIEQGLKDGSWKLVLTGFGDFDQNLKLLEVKDPQTVKNSGWIEFHSVGEARPSSPLSNIREYFWGYKQLVQKINPDLVFSATFERLLPSPMYPTIVVVHDVIPMVTGQYSRKNFLTNIFKGLYYRLIMWQRVKKAVHIITSSNFSKEDIARIGRINHRNITTIYLGITDRFKNASYSEKTVNQVLQSYNLGNIKQRDEYLLYDGGFEANKNSDKLLQIYEFIHHHRNIKLVVTGGGFEFVNGSAIPTNERTRVFWSKVIDKSLTEYVIPVGRVNEDELTVLTQNATAYINVSGYEGFGLGPLQAMASGTPTIVSNLGSFPEVSGPGALVIDPGDPRNAAGEVLELLESDENMKELRRKGLEHAAGFDWDQTFGQTWNLVNHYLHEPRS